MICLRLPYLFSVFHLCLVLYRLLQRAYHDTLWVIPVVDSSSLQIFMIAFKGVKKCGFTLGDDHLLQPALFPMPEPKATHGALGFKAGRSCCDLIQPVKENAVFVLGAGGEQGCFIACRAQTCRAEPLVLLCHLQRSPCSTEMAAKGWGPARSQGSVPMPLPALQVHQLIPILTKFCRPCSITQYLEKCKFQNIM